MKKILSFVLVLAMVLGSVAFVSAADLTDLEGKPYETAATVLADLGVINGYADKTFKGENGINRAEFVTMIIQALGFNPQKGGAQKFEDVDPNKWYGPYVAYAADLGIVYGKTATTFGPTDPVTLDQAIAFTTRALGYYDSSVIKSVNRALGLGLLDGVKTGGTAATRGDVAQLVYNAANKAIGTVDANGAWTPNGVGNDNFFARLGGTLQNPAVITIADCGKVNLVDKIGKQARLVKSGNTVIGLGAIESTTLTGYWNAGNFVSGGVSYVVDVPAATNPAAIPLYDNGERNATANVTAATAVAPVTIEAAVNGRTITEIYSVVDWTPTNTIVADAAGTLVPGFTGTMANWDLNMNQAIDTNLFTLKGVDTLADIDKTKAVIYVYRGASNPAGKVRLVEVGQEVVTGVVTKVSNIVAATGLGWTLTVNGKDYPTTAGQNPALVGAEVNMKLDYYGNAADVAPVGPATVTTNYGLLLDSVIASDLAGGDKVQMKIADNTTKVFTLSSALTAAQKATIEGVMIPGNAGKLMEYTVDANGALATLVVSGLIADAGKQAANFTLTAAGSLDGKYLADDIVVIKDTGLAAAAPNNDFNKVYTAANVTFAKKADLAAGSYTAAYKSSATTGKITHILVKSNTITASSVIGVYNGYAKELVGSASLFNNSFLVSGAAANYYSAGAAVDAAAVGIAADGLRLLTINSDGTVATTTTLIANATPITATVNAAVVTVAAGDGLAIAGGDANVVKNATSGVFYNLSNPIVYAKGATTFSVSTVAAAVAANATKAVTFYDVTGDGLYDYIIF